MEDHLRTIIHIDIDCFYAQVEMIRNPNLKKKPLGIQQKNIVVTSNYVAREYGIKKCMLITEARKLCPNLVLVNGEDLYNYRQISYKVTSILQEYSKIVERLGFDENFIDVTDLVTQKLKCSSDTDSIGLQFGEPEVLCDCGCTERISVGSQIAQDIRNHIYKELHLTICAGIAHNKLLAKIVGGKNKPNKQTFMFPNSAPELVLSLEFVKNIPWIGSVAAQQLSTINIFKVNQLQNCNIVQLKNIFDLEKAQTMKNLSFGIDNTPVKKSGKPQSIGLEDSYKALTSEKDAEDKLQGLLRRLMKLVTEDKRIPKTVKLTARKLDPKHPHASVRETRQCNIDTPLENEAKLMNIVMALFRKVVGTNKFHITLLGLSFTKFSEETHIKNTLTRYFIPDKVTPIVGFRDQKIILPLSEYSNEGPSSPKQSSDFNKFVTNEIPEYNYFPQILNSTNAGLCTENKILCPPHANKEVFKELPIDLQEELWNDYKRKIITEESQRPCKKLKSNSSILNYIVRKKKI